MKKVVLFDTFAYNCPFFYTFGNGNINNGYNCDHPEQEYMEDVEDEEDIEETEMKECGCCYTFSCPLGFKAEQQDWLDKDQIDWDGLCESGEVEEGEYFLVDVGEDATEEQRQAIWNYDLYIHRYDKKWLDEHGIENSLCD